ncbi:S1 RNA-binding domain-containing protein [Oscillibacter sp.]|uniref:S1 RNA-binding domain-containing protein n=1 Tax=Oscillibacter sp. TaxID=1945593 RepID=UPI00260E7E9F|nr:S1 RNA-binding domain-containing protein [Oscillibacter sp.]MDD3347550.1 S1 RNA-binding domain-containing protein [Oscillibacter sp.]
MPLNQLFPPEGLRPPNTYALSDLKEALEQGSILEGTVQRCDTSHTLHLPLGSIAGQIPIGEAIAPWISGSNRDISVISRVGKQTCFTVQKLYADEKGAPMALLSRRAAQEAAMAFFMEHLVPGTVLTCRVTRLETFGVFLDIGCGIIAMLPIEHISVSRISHPKERFREGQKILAVVWSVDREARRITMTHRELLGTWMETASRFAPGETVRGIVRSVKEYGSFIELMPNLSGLADVREGLTPGDGVSVYIKSIRPERMKIKLHIVEKLPAPMEAEPLSYQITDGTLTHWVYSPPGFERAPIETDFTASAP